jgi:hypothetical protein
MMSLPDKLVDESSLTRRQVQALSNYMRVIFGEIRLREAASILTTGRTKGDRQRELTVGSYYRTLTQARSNVRKSVVTLVVGLWLGAIRTEDVRRLFELVGTGTRELSEEEQERFMQVLEALLRRIVA